MSYYFSSLMIAINIQYISWFHVNFNIFIFIFQKSIIFWGWATLNLYNDFGKRNFNYINSDIHEHEIYSLFYFFLVSLHTQKCLGFISHFLLRTNPGEDLRRPYWTSYGGNHHTCSDHFIHFLMLCYKILNSIIDCITKSFLLLC